jgi:hypothetical protein
MDQIEILIPRPTVNERAAFTATAYFRDSSDSTADAPSSADYRIDDPITGRVLRDWTTLTAAASIAIAITDDDNAVQGCADREMRQITVRGNAGDSQAIGRALWVVENLVGMV